MGQTIDQLSKNSISKYAMVIAAARRGRDLLDGAQPLAQSGATKPVTIALEEISQGAIIVDTRTDFTP